MPKQKVRSVGVLQIRYRPIEEKYILKYAESGQNISELIRLWIREHGEQDFPDIPLYAQVAAERIELTKKQLEERDRIKNMSPQEYAEQILLGKVRNNIVEFRGNHGEVIEKSLFNIKERNAENDSEISMHIALVNRDYVYADGYPPTEEQYADIFKGW